MKLSIDPGLKKRCPSIALGLVTAHVRTADSPLELLGELYRCEESILKAVDPRALMDAPAISATRAGYRALGKDPARYRGSAEALLRRLVSGKHFPNVNCVVDIVNLVSVESRLPIGLYDTAQIQGDVVFRTGKKGETYKGIGKFDLNLEDLPVFADAAGPHGSPTSDSERTMVTPSTEHVAAILISFSGPQPLDAWCRRIGSLLGQYAEGREIQTEFVS
ncbi:MAG TPA: phenylalanine--tRNA ligase beta subunit-related protein [Candidatus Eisenbacteria bacterium]|nr:phenylalanine--tRNA ligase beta subunit-related protein [Candidatus Eisenbacteria bacterium]